MFRPALAILIALCAVCGPILAQQPPESAPDSRPTSRPLPIGKDGRKMSAAEQDERIARLDLAIPKHDKESYAKDEKSGVAWSYLHRGPEDADLLVVGDRVKAHMTLWLAKDGTEISSTRRREDKKSQPESFDSGAFIRGLNVVSPHLRPGDKVRIDIPAAMAFGASGLRGRIGPDEDLIYCIQVLRVEGHVDIPAFPVWDDAKASKLGDDSAYMVIKDGEGRMAGNNAAVAFEYVLWDDHANIIDSSLYPNKPPVGGQSGRFGREFQNVISQIARVGGEYIVRVPFKKMFPGEAHVIVDPNSQYIYFYLMTRELAPFTDPIDEKMQKDPNGLEYVVVRPGEGEKTKPEDRVHMHYVYWTLPDGKLVDASYTRAITNNFRQVGLIPGMRQALAKIAPGGLIRARIPAALAWGPGGRIGVEPNTDILLQVELFPMDVPRDDPRGIESGRGKRFQEAKPKAREKGEGKKERDEDDDDVEDHDESEDK